MYRAQTPNATHLLPTQATWLLQRVRLSSQYERGAQKQPGQAVVERDCACVLQIRVSGVWGPERHVYVGTPHMYVRHRNTSATRRKRLSRSAVLSAMLALR